MCRQDAIAANSSLASTAAEQLDDETAKQLTALLATEYLSRRY
jgi:hypothetical protein